MRFVFLMLALGLLCLADSPARDGRKPEKDLAGQVRDHGGPVAGASVRFQGDAAAVTTDAAGRFRLPLRATSPNTVAAAKVGYFIAGARADAQPLVLTLKPLPDKDNEDYAWVDPHADATKPHNCGNCHGEMVREWSASGHARAAVNRRFLNLFDGSDWHGRQGIGWSLLADHKDGAGVCTACHAPTVPFAGDAYHDLRKATGVAARGVHCDYCHKIAAVDNERIGLTHGRFGFKLLRPAQGQLFFGSLADSDRGDDAYAPLYRQSIYCASCHEGTVFGVHVYGTYGEWLDSPARKKGQECQTCHMAPSGKMKNVAPGKDGNDRDPQTLANHRFFAGSQADMLRRCLRVAVRINQRRRLLRVQVEVAAEEVGHRVPTGFADRNLVLAVEALAENGKPVTLKTGPTLAKLAGEELAGKPGRLFAKVLQDFDGKSPVPFWRARAEPLADTRLTPGRKEATEFYFPMESKKVRILLVQRRFWPETTKAKSWPQDQIVVLERTIAVKPGEETLWSAP